MIQRVFERLKTDYKLGICLLSVVLIGCFESDYSKLVKSEMKKDIVNDSLFLGLRLGQKKKEFFETCWQLNQQEKVSNGQDMFVRYELPSVESKNGTGDMTMLFYGIFDEKKVMTGMKLRFYYEAWSIWNKAVQSDQLVHAVKDSLSKWYPGNDFLKVDLSKNEQQLWVKVDGNRRITLKPLDDPKLVSAQIDDLRYVLHE